MNSPKKLKILFAIGRLSVGGAEKLLTKQLSAINRQNFDPYLITLFPEQKDSFQDQLEFEKNKWKKFNFNSLFNFVEWYKLFKFLKKEKFDVVITSLFSANLIVRIAAILSGVSVIVAYEHNLYPNKHFWQIWADWLLAKRTKAIIVDSGAVRIFTAKQEGIPIEKFKTMYIPPLLNNKKVRNPEIIRKELGIPPEGKIILTVSRLVEEKGHKYLIGAAAKVIKKFGNVYFVIVGWGPLEESLKSKVKSQKLENRVLLPGKMDIQEVLPLADIYVDPAIMTDLPIAIMEAMKRGKSIVASAIGEISVFVKDGVTGFLVEPRNSSMLAEKIEYLLKNEDLRRKFGSSAENMVCKYSLKEYEKQFENLIISLLKQ